MQNEINNISNLISGRSVFITVTPCSWRRSVKVMSEIYLKFSVLKQSKIASVFL